MAKTVNIDTPNPALDKEVQDAISMQNARETKQILMKQGVTSLVNYQDEQVRTVSGTSYVEFENLRQAFATTGGWVEIGFKTTCYNTGLEVFAKLIVDGEMKDISFVEIGGLWVRFAGFLVAGNHVVNVAFKTSSGAAGTVGDDFAGNAVPTSLWVTETIL